MKNPGQVTKFFNNNIIWQCTVQAATRQDAVRQAFQNPKHKIYANDKGGTHKSTAVETK